MKISRYFFQIFLLSLLVFQVYAGNQTTLVSSDLIELSGPRDKVDSFNNHKKYQNSNESKELPLFKKFPELFIQLPHQILGSFPTPVKRLEKLEKLIGFKNIYIKQDSLSGTKSDDEAAQVFGGNKVRKLEFLLADALNADVETVVTVGAAGSNHALATAIYSQMLDLGCIIMLTPQENTSYVRRNLLMDLYYNPDIKAYASDAQRTVGIFNTSCEYILDDKKSPYFIPMGGSNEIGAIGFVNAAFELKEQIEKGELPEPDLIYVTAGSCGTAAGLILGVKAAGLKGKVVAVKISGTRESKSKAISEIISKTNQYLNKLHSSFPIFEITENDYRIIDDFAGEKYAKITVEAASAIKLLKLSEKIQLDGTYTGKTFAAMLADLKKPETKDKNVLFWNTYCAGDFEDITKNMNYLELPKLLQGYFNVPVQDLDQGC
ncbi:MAG: 1-aminocyclopropane-1-carboxylate deaminase [candidate division TM6 bacterium GW2011_GWF2_37_49]|nr:MAG: 1-aminocyclopropane-1-carboxylate deaminase [candidate division TM6 bacterium GW2011_GWF2_37_49]